MKITTLKISKILLNLAGLFVFVRDQRDADVGKFAWDVFFVKPR